MPKVIARTEHPDSREVQAFYDDGSKVIYDERTKTFTLYRWPTQNDILAAASGDVAAQETFLQWIAPVRYTPPTLADAPRHTAEVGSGDDD